MMSYTFLACLGRERLRLSEEYSMTNRAFVLSRRCENTIYFVFLFTPDSLRGYLSINVGANNARRCRLVTTSVHRDRLQNFPERYCRIALKKRTLLTFCSHVNARFIEVDGVRDLYSHVLGTYSSNISMWYLIWYNNYKIILFKDKSSRRISSFLLCVYRYIEYSSTSRQNVNVFRSWSRMQSRQS